MKKLLHPSDNKILIKFIGKRIQQISNNISNNIYTNISNTYKLYNSSNLKNRLKELIPIRQKEISEISLIYY